MITFPPFQSKGGEGDLKKIGEQNWKQTNNNTVLLHRSLVNNFLVKTSKLQCQIPDSPKNAPKVARHRVSSSIVGKVADGALKG